MYKEYHLSQGIFYNFVNFSPQHLHIYQNLILVRCIGISRTFHVSLSRCQKDGIFYHISGARFTNIKNIRSKPNITNKPSITNITNITKERKGIFQRLGHSQYPDFTHLSVPRTCFDDFSP